ncbi:MAG: hypothetical protein H5T63_11450 [Chloroflexi bacterium]|nr:hypothetical protein [Chloroflexota bacterium]
MANVGYLEGTDPLVLTQLAVRGIGTVPISNGFDGHGKYINHLVPADHIAVVIGYLHKLLPVPERFMKPKDLLFSCMTHAIPVLLIVPKADQEAARNTLGEARDYVELVEPAELYQAVMKKISSDAARSI